MKRVYRYAIIRFMPFVETGEFVNVGILMSDVQRGKFRFCLLDRKFSRVTRFFDQMEQGIYLKVIRSLREELEELEAVAYGKSADFTERLFDEMTRPREQVIRFSDPRIALGDAMDQELQKLFGYYVEQTLLGRDLSDEHRYDREM